ncbi:MAG: efflux RND transporter periplasmic adaptor subunit [Acidobacteriota bacterium]
MKKLFGILFALALVAGFVGTLFYLNEQSQEEPVRYATQAPTRAEIVKKTVATGSVVPRKEVEIKPQISGIVDELYVEPGDTVARGDLIARIQVVPDMVRLNDAEARVAQARITLQNAELDVERNRRLVDDGTISESAFQQFQQALDTARQELEAAGSNLEIVQKGATARSGAASNTLVRSTIDGMVLEVPVEEGNSVIEANTFNDGTTLATVADMDEMVFEGKVDESEVGKLELGMELLLTVGAIDQETFRAALEHIAPKGVEEDGAIQFEIRAAIELDEAAPFLRANYSANADIVLDRRIDVLAIDEALLQFDPEQRPFVEVLVEPDRFERRDVEIGLSDGLMIEIVDGLEESEQVKNPNPQQAGA